MLSMRVARGIAVATLVTGVIYIASDTVIDGCFVRGFNKEFAQLNGLFEPIEKPQETENTLWSHAKMVRLRLKNRTSMSTRIALTSILALRKNRVWRDHSVTMRRWNDNDADFQFVPRNQSRESNFKSLEVRCTQHAKCEVRIICRALPRVRDVFPLSKYVHSQFVEDFTQKPVTCLIITGLVGIFVHLRVSQIHFSHVAISYTRVVEHAEVWRIFAASVSHYDLWHILFNVSTAYSVSFLETSLGSIVFVKYIVILMAGSMVVMMAMVHFLATRCNSNSSGLRDQMALGYSAVLFGLIAVACATSKRYCLLPGVCFDTHNVPTPWQRPFKFNLAPFVLMAITQCVVRQSSLLGHLSGLLVGFVVPWLPLTPPAVVYSCGLWAAHLSQQPPDRVGRARTAVWIACSVLVGAGCLMAAIFSSPTEVLSSALGVALWVKCTRCQPESASLAEAPASTAGRVRILRQFAALGCCVECYWLLLLTTATCALRHMIDGPNDRDGVGLSISTAILLTAGTCMLSCLARLCFLRWDACAGALEQRFRCLCERATDEETLALVWDHSAPPGGVHGDENPGAFVPEPEGPRGEAVNETSDVNLVRAKRLGFLQDTQRR